MRRICNTTITSLAAWVFSGSAALAILGACATDDTGPKDTTMDYWSKKKGDCEEVLKSPHAYDLSQITRCTKMWEMYRYVDNIPLKDRSMYAVAFSTVSHKAPDAYDRAIADAALTRLCIPRHPLDGSGQVREEIPDSLQCNTVSDLSIGGKAVASSNPYQRMKATVEVSDVSDKEMSRAATVYKKGSTQRQKENLGKAINFYREALEIYPNYVAAKYDLACALAVSGDERGALRELEELNTWNDAEAQQRIVKARSDSDFESIRDNPNFKLITGYVRVVIVNGASAIGEEHVASMKKRLESKNIPVAQVGKSSGVVLSPQIMYREGFEDYAYKIRDVLGNSKMAVTLDRRKGGMDDVLVLWGQPEAAAIGAGQNAPVVQGQRAQGSENKLDDLADSVDNMKKSVDHTRDVGKSLTSF